MLRISSVMDNILVQLLNLDLDGDILVSKHIEERGTYGDLVLWDIKTFKKLKNVNFSPRFRRKPSIDQGVCFYLSQQQATLEVYDFATSGKSTARENAFNVFFFWRSER